MLRMLAISGFLALAGCAGATPGTMVPAPAAQAPAPHETPIDDTLTLALGAHARLPDGSELAYTQLVNDSRCPANVQCIWAGDAEIQLRWTPRQGPPETFSLHTTPRQGQSASHPIGHLTVTLQSLERGIAPSATLRITRQSP